MPFQHVDQLLSWLAEAGIDYLELSGPDRQLCLGRAIQQEPLVRTTDGASTDTHAVTVRAPNGGGPCCTQPSDAGRSARTLWKPSRTGQTIAPLQVGALLVPVEAPRDEVIVEVVVLEGALVGFGAEISDFPTSRAGA